MKTKFKDQLIPVGPDTPFCGLRFNCPPTHGELNQICSILSSLNKKFPYLEIVVNDNFEIIIRKTLGI